MRSYNAGTAALLETASGIDARVLVWITARNRMTQAPETIGIWSGDETVTLVVEGQSRVYFGGGALIDVEPIAYQVGLVVRAQTLTFAPFAPEVEAALRAHEPRLARVEIHRAVFNPETGALAGAIDREARLFTGLIDTVAFQSPEFEGDPGCVVTLSSEAVLLTKPLHDLRSNEARKAAFGGDALLRYASVSGPVTTWWGERRRRVAGRRAVAPPVPGARGNGDGGR
jgi:hypothetical protein